MLVVLNILPFPSDVVPFVVYVEKRGEIARARVFAYS